MTPKWIDEAAETILSNWILWEADADTLGTVEQDSSVGEDYLRRMIVDAIDDAMKNWQVSGGRK